MTDDDDVWVDTLAGRAMADPRPAAAYEAQRLREAILRQGSAQVAGVPARDPQRELELLARARHEGLIDPARLAARARWPRVLTARPAMLAYAATLACVAIALAIFLRPVAELERVRGGPDGTALIEVADPIALKTELLKELRAAGISATGYERFGVQGIDADLPRPVPESVRAVLRKHHLEVPADGVLKIEIIRPDTP